MAKGNYCPSIVGMTAEQARKQTLDVQDSIANKLLAACYASIEQKSKQGFDNCSIPLSSDKVRFIDNTISILKSKGYQVKRDKGYDQRDQQSWDYLIIQW